MNPEIMIIGVIGVGIVFWIFCGIFHFIRIFTTKIEVGDRFRSYDNYCSPWDNDRFRTAVVLKVQEDWIRYSIHDANGNVIYACRDSRRNEFLETYTHKVPTQNKQTGYYL